MNDTTTVDVEIAAAEVEEGAPEQNPVLFLHDIERTYRQGDNLLNILRRAELAVWPGQLVALIAPSGAGKSARIY